MPVMSAARHAPLALRSHRQTTSCCPPETPRIASPNTKTKARPSPAAAPATNSPNGPPSGWGPPAACGAPGNSPPADAPPPHPRQGLALPHPGPRPRTPEARPTCSGAPGTGPWSPHVAAFHADKAPGGRAGVLPTALRGSVAHHRCGRSHGHSCRSPQCAPVRQQALQHPLHASWIALPRPELQEKSCPNPGSEGGRGVQGGLRSSYLWLTAVLIHLCPPPPPSPGLADAPAGTACHWRAMPHRYAPTAAIPHTNPEPALCVVVGVTNGGTKKGRVAAIRAPPRLATQGEKDMKVQQQHPDDVCTSRCARHTNTQAVALGLGCGRQKRQNARIILQGAYPKPPKSPANLAAQHQQLWYPPKPKKGTSNFMAPNRCGPNHP